MMKVAKLTGIGKRFENQDAMGIGRWGAWLVAGVFDGLGGHSGGKIAAESACKAAFEAEGNVRERLAAANLAVVRSQKSTGLISMRTTAVLLMVDEEHARWAHCGDSRLYRVRDGEVAQLTLDHSVPQALVRQGEIRPEDIRKHEDRSRVTRALGTNDLRMDDGDDAALPGDLYLLVSDGFWEPVDEAAILNCMRDTKDPETVLTRMEKIITAIRLREMENKQGR